MTATTPGRANPPYELTHQPDGTSWTARENLADILTRELLGPDSGDEEVLDVPPDSRYLIGRIAPVRLTDEPEVPSVDDDDADSTVDLGDDLDALESRGVPMTTVDDSTIDADEDNGGDRDDEPVKRGLMIPASMGLRFQIPCDLASFTIRRPGVSTTPKPPAKSRQPGAPSAASAAHLSTYRKRLRSRTLHPAQLTR